ncbi:putative protein kinase RLK-Pelle-DLSV family [Rosa chinensis]|uniref:non-specific serine/threonine protein kinase n=1 Tax=Rosa chinensis TaxID=74649 RepID=A0A2P6SAT7_ROSCH|nr:putative protein kinase RLK-Pelle-DLSV family [Rosa chinensis]
MCYMTFVRESLRPNHCSLVLNFKNYIFAESTARSCGSCGTNLIPYPLSTGPKCGDVTYYSFHCNISTGQLSFEAPSGTYHVTSINADTQTFVIQANDADECRDKKFLKLIQSSPYNVTNMCNADPTRFSPDLSFKGGYEVEVAWKSPLEPPCSSSTDCKDWPRSICDAALDGKNRCLCPANSKWDSRSLNCTQEVGHRKQTGEQGKMTLALIIAKAGQIFKSVQHDSERKVKNLIESGRFKDDDTEGIDVPSFDLESILVATTYFSNANKLGQGGFGPVYKGKLPGGEEISVKRLSSCSGQGLEEFKNEVLLIAILQHRNLVRLLGYCAEGDEKMLIYEANKSLDSFIFDSRLRVIHRVLKTSNILQGEEMNPKISDFGLARIFGGNETSENTNRVVGTYGYMSPEYALDGLFLAWHLWKEQKALYLLEQTLGHSCNKDEYFKCVNVGLLCVQEDPGDWPTMSQVVFMLGSETATIPTPKQPAFIVN